MNFISFLLAVLIEAGVIYFSLGISNNGESTLSVVAALVFFFVGSFLNWHAFSIPPEKNSGI